MDLNETRRKRSIPDWMKSSDSSPIKSPNKTNSRVGFKQQRPSYPAISIKKTKQIPKPANDVVPHTSKHHREKNVGPAFSSRVKDNQDLGSKECSSSFSVDFQAENTSVDNEYIMTVDELTCVAQEVINEARQKGRLL